MVLERRGGDHDHDVVARGRARAARATCARRSAAAAGPSCRVPARQASGPLRVEAQDHAHERARDPQRVRDRRRARRRRPALEARRAEHDARDAARGEEPHVGTVGTPATRPGGAGSRRPTSAHERRAGRGLGRGELPTRPGHRPAAGARRPPPRRRPRAPRARPRPDSPTRTPSRPSKRSASGTWLDQRPVSSRPTSSG